MSEPLTLNISKSDRPIYSDILKSGPLKGRYNKEIFLLAMVLGFKEGERISIKGHKESFIRAESLNSDDIALINALAITEERRPDVISDKRNVFEIAEEYAHSGLNILRKLVNEQGTFIKKYETFLREHLETIDE